MADTIKTRILLRNDTLANWEAANSVTLKAGEVAIATLDGNLAEVRVGNNTNWAASRKLRIEAGQISGLIDTINTQVNGLAQEYQLTAGTGDDTNKWFLQKRALSGGDWTTVNTLDLTQLTGYALSTDVDVLVGAVSAETLVSANAYADAAVDALSIDNYMLTADFSALSNEIGLSAASASNPVVTKDDIADLAGAMHFRGAVTPNDGETDAEALARVITDPASGDVAIITTTSKEYVYNGTTWIELGDEVLYATKAEVNTVSAQLTSDIAGLTADVDYLSGVIDDTRTTLETVSSDYLTSTDKTELETLVGTVSAETLVSANAYTDEAIDALSIGDYALSADVTALVGAVSAETLVSANAYTDATVATVSAETLLSANTYTDDAVAALSIDDYIKHGEATADDLSGYFVFDCGGASYRDGEQAATEA